MLSRRNYTPNSVSADDEDLLGPRNYTPNSVSADDEDLLGQFPY